MQENPKIKKLCGTDLLSRITPFLSFLVVVLVFGLLTDGRIFQSRNWKTLFNNMFSISLGACAMSFIVAQGAKDMAMGSEAAVCAMIGYFASKLSVDLILPAAVLTGVCLGFIIGLAITVLNVPNFIGTVAIGGLLTGIVEITLGAGSKPFPFQILQWDKTWIKAAVLLLFFLVGYILFEYSTFGRGCRTIGSNREAARQSGINVQRNVILSYMITGATAGLIGFFSIIRSATVSTATGSNLQVNALIALMLGGMPLTGGYAARFRSAILGSLTVTFLNYGMQICGLGDQRQQLVRGLVFLFAIYIMSDRRALTH